MNLYLIITYEDGGIDGLGNIQTLFDYDVAFKAVVDHVTKEERVEFRNPNADELLEDYYTAYREYCDENACPEHNVLCLEVKEVPSDSSSDKYISKPYKGDFSSSR